MLEKKLATQNIIISDEVIEEGVLSLDIKHPTFYFSGAPIATADQISLWSILFYTKVNINKMQIAEGLATELSLSSLSLEHSILSPLLVKMTGESSLGILKGDVALRERNVRIEISGGRENKAFRKYLKKSKEGWYYESKF